MGTSVTLPAMGESVTEGTIIKWLKAEGDTVTEDEPLVEISTDKIDTELPAPTSGVLAKIIVGEDQTVDVGAELAVIDEGASASTKPSAPADPAQAEERPVPAVSAQAEERPAPPPQAPALEKQEKPHRRVVSPLVRRLAGDLGIDPEAVPASDPSGRITKADVLAAARAGLARGYAAPTGPLDLPPSRYQVPAEGHLDVPFDRVRAAISEHMVHSTQTAAQATNVIEVDMSAIADLRERIGGEFAAREGMPLTFTPFIASAVVGALRTYPEFNAHLDEDGRTARLFRNIHLGVAIGRDEGLIVPVVHDAGELSLIGLARSLADIGQRAVTRGGLTPDDVVGGTFTISNYGALGSLFDTAIINQPQVAIMGIGAVQKRPAVVSAGGQDTIGIRHTMLLSLCYDHRWIDGHQAARFNARVKQILEQGDHAADLGA